MNILVVLTIIHNNQFSFCSFHYYLDKKTKSLNSLYIAPPLFIIQDQYNNNFTPNPKVKAGNRIDHTLTVSLAFNTIGSDKSQITGNCDKLIVLLRLLGTLTYDIREYK